MVVGRQSATLLAPAVRVHPSAVKGMVDGRLSATLPAPTVRDLKATGNFVEINHEVAGAAGLPVTLSGQQKLFTSAKSMPQSPAIVYDPDNATGNLIGLWEVSPSVLYVCCACGPDAGIYY